MARAKRTCVIMKNLSKILFLGLTLFLLNSCGLFFNCTEGSGEIITKTFDDLKFDEVSISISANVLFVQDENARIELSTYENFFELIEVDNASKRVKIKSDGCLNSDERTRLTVYYQDLSEITINGSSDLKFSDTLITKNFSLKINGSGDIDLPVKANSVEVKINGSGDALVYGSAKDCEFKINGSGNIQAKDLVAENGKVGINGSGDVSVNASKSLEASITGSGDIEYLGNPKEFEGKSTGSGSIKKLSN